MSVVVVGLEQSQAPLDVLERVAVPEDSLAKVLATLHERPNFAEVVVLSTCLRTELYAVVERFHDGVADLQELLAERAGASTEDVAEHMTVLFDDLVPQHLFEVACGLRSAVLGETEVLGQVRRAGERAVAERAAGPVLGAMFRHAVQAGRRVRATTAISRGATSLSHVAVELVLERLGRSPRGSKPTMSATPLSSTKVVVVGAGEMGKGVVDALAGRGVSVVVVNRTRSRAATLAARVQGALAFGMDQLAQSMAMADAVVVTTGSSIPLLAKDVVGTAVAGRRLEQPLVIVDLSVPRNVDPDLGHMEGVELFDMDDLRSRAQVAIEGRRGELDAALEIVRGEVERYRAAERARGAAPIVSALRDRLEYLRQREVERHRHYLSYQGLDEAQWQAVDAVTRDVLSKLLHQPSVALKASSGTPKGERLVEALRELFEL